VLQPGDRVGRYEVVRLLALSRCSAAFLARDTTTGDLVSLKCPPECAVPDDRRRLQREAALLRGLHHPNLQSLAALPAPPDSDCIALAYEAGETLRERLNRGLPALNEALAIADQVAAALEFLHAHGILHRDVKPENVVLTPDGRAVLIDFGSAAQLRPGLFHRRAQRPPGTPDYAAPELIAGRRGDERVDVYELGELLYELVTGVPPFGGDSAAAVMYQHLHQAPPSPRALRPDLPPALDAFILRALATAPRERYQTVTALRQELATIRDGLAGAEPAAPASAHRRT